ncbi:hypothetical protein G6011_03895 [Alternaria panax]|uniref:Uncharacterized protein n=1 Tax=Alternaria panax TaxID=48097 RepID=A0AAD4IFW1_9PLEO|nr:hypothetical protein G6011_03895 [Alternaria panax]
MFGKRRRAASNPPQRAPPPSASASLAASKAFIKSAESNGDLSSAAAAAALRTHPTTPAPVGDTVTKRMARRGSLSSNGSFSRQQPGAPGLRRQSSAGSMTERSFRAPSPGRGSPADTDAPPVPPMPKNVPQQGSAVHRRASSLEPAYRGGSPAPAGGRGRGVSLDRSANPGGRAQLPASHLAHVSEEDDASRSVNFSRPMSPGAIGTRQNPELPSSKGWFGGPVVNQDAVQRMASTSRPKTSSGVSSGVSSYHLQNAHRSVQSAAEGPVKTHHVSQGVQGARLSSGSMRTKPSASAVQSQSYLPPRAPRPVDPNSPDAIYDPSTRKFIHKQDAMARHRELHEEAEPARQQYVSQHVDTLHPVHIPENQMGRGSPSPIRHYVRQEQPTPQKREEPVSHAPGPQLSTATATRHSDDFADADFPPQEASTSRKLEDSGYGTIVGHEDDVVSPKFAANQDSSYPRLATPANSTPAGSVSGQGRGRLPEAHDRHASLSPPRTAHFAAVPVELAGTKHDPLPRSVSPAKSVLKSSPSVSRRGGSPATANGRLSARFAPSEASDTGSDDGGRKKKKNVRVSFEDEPVLLGKTTDTEAPSHGALDAPKWSPIAEKEDEFEDFMKPRAALPVFGSIREKERRPQENMAEKVTETFPTSNASSDTALGNIVVEDFAQKHAAYGNPLPPEVTTVEGSGYVSDSSDYSDTHKPMQALQQPPAPEPKSLSMSQEESPETAASVTEQIVEVPNIALQPATPSPYEKSEPVYQSMTIPGGWDEDVPEPARQTVSSILATSAPSSDSMKQQPQAITQPDGYDETTDDNSSVYSDAYEDLSDGEGFGSINALMEKSAVASSSGLISSKYANTDATDKPTSKLQLDTSIDDSRDSDTTPTQDWNAAQQHWSGVNASLKKPDVRPEHTQAPPEQASHAQEVVSRVMQAPVPEERSAPSGSREYTPDTTPERKVTAIPPRRTTTPLADQSLAKPLKSALKKSPAPQPVRPAESQPRTTLRTAAPREGSSQTHMKRTMRGGPDPASRTGPQMGSTMRSSMRGPSDTAPRAPPQMRQSMRSADASPAPNMGLAASRHSMVPMDTKPPRGALQKRNIPPAAATKGRPQSMPAAKPMAAPAPTYDSDSDASASSFQRERARKRGGREQGGRYTMRGSMRQEPAPTMRANAPAPKQVRAISPPATPSSNMRRSMRPSSPTPEPVKSSKFSIRSLSPMGRFRKGSDVRPSSPIPPMPVFNKQTLPPKPSKAPRQKVPPAKASKAPFQSRFADSSDEEDDARPSRFQSRFDDSDDDEPTDYTLPPGLAPVRGIPRKAGEEDGDSTDLEEEADDEPLNFVPKTAPVTNGANSMNGIAGAQGAALSAGSLRDSKHAPLPSFGAASKTKEKRGFFGLGKKKKNTTTQPEAAQAQPAAAQHVPAPDEIPMPPAQRNRDMTHPMTPIDEDKEFGNPRPVSPRSPKLQRRKTPEWPLQPPPAIGTDDRPVSSDGVTTRRPRFANRQSSAISNASAPIVDAQGRSVSYGRSGKKKKFQGLRRVFGLND